MNAAAGCPTMASHELSDSRRKQLCSWLFFRAGDPVGGAAAQRLWELSAAYPDRMYCPVDHYVSGPEKELLLQATDFCMLPSRFEPCGLVDVEFAWVSDVLPVIWTPWYAGLQYVCYRDTSQLVRLTYMRP
jgi:glycogen synthase